MGTFWVAIGLAGGFYAFLVAVVTAGKIADRAWDARAQARKISASQAAAIARVGHIGECRHCMRETGGTEVAVACPGQHWLLPSRKDQT